MASAAEEFAKKISEDYQTKVGDRTEYNLFSKLVDICRGEILKTLSSKQKVLFEKLPIVLVPAPDVDATLVNVPGHEKECIMVIGLRYFLTLHLMLNANIWAALNSKLTDNRILAEMSNTLCQLFAYRFVKRPIDHLPSFMINSSVETNLGWASDIGLKFAIGCFVIGHEFAHLLEQKKDDSITTISNSSWFGQMVTRFCKCDKLSE